MTGPEQDAQHAVPSRYFPIGGTGYWCSGFADFENADPIARMPAGRWPWNSMCRPGPCIDSCKKRHLPAGSEGMKSGGTGLSS